MPPLLRDPIVCVATLDPCLVHSGMGSVSWLLLASLALACAMLFFMHVVCPACRSGRFSLGPFGPRMCEPCRRAMESWRDERLMRIRSMEQALASRRTREDRLRILDAILEQARAVAARERLGVDLGGRGLVSKYESLIRQESADHGDGTGPSHQIEDMVEESRECDGSDSPISGEWCFKPVNTMTGATGYIVLRDIPKTRLLVDDREIELAGGFRGFHSVPAGVHTLVMEPCGSFTHMPGVRVYVHPGGCVVLRYDHEQDKFVSDEPWGAEYASKALRGTMSGSLHEWPRPD
ncbi:MAG: hypothetical protein HY815_23155 [Candidatus Riflebacteria bacterium]|nr:hypothetical protein [Candidatus Riflebacteria bacterium]